jgi:outer membrane protein TolC
MPQKNLTLCRKPYSFMKIKYLSIILFVTLTMPAFGAATWTEEFLAQYRPPSRPDPNALLTGTQHFDLAALQQGGAVPLGIDDLLRLMLQNNLDVTVNSLPPQTAEFLINTFLQPFDPSLRISATAARNTTLGTSSLSGAPTLSALTHTYSIGYGQTLMTGTSVGVNWIMTRNSSNNTFLLYNPAYSGALQYTLSQHLLRDRPRYVNDRQIRVAQNNQKISDVQFEQQLIDLVSQAQNTYWDLVYAQEDIKVKARSMDLAQKTLDENKIQADVGTMAPIDVVQAESEAASRQVDLIKATYLETQVEDQVKKLISSSPDPGTVFAKLNPMNQAQLPSPSDVLPLQDAIRYALENRPEMRVSDLQLKNTQIDVDYTANHLKPVFDINASYTQNGTGGVKNVRAGGNSTPIIAVIPGGLGDALQQMFGYNFNGYALGFTLQIPLSKRAIGADHDRAVSSQRTAQAQSAATAQKIVLDVRNALNEVEMTRAQITASQKARELAEQRLSAEQTKFELGVSTIRFVLDEQRNVATAQETELQSIISYTKSLVQFDRAIGRTLRLNNIDIDKVGPKTQSVAN